jgi:hypothetical protein
VPEWLHAGAPGEIVWQTLLVRLLSAAAFGAFIGGVYAVSQRRPPGMALPLITTLVLLTMLVAMTTIVIGDSIARAFGLVGALSIVRFRTVVEDTRDTSFVIFAVVVGMALGAGNVLICLIGVPLVSAIAIGLSFIGQIVPSAGQRRLEIRVGAGREPEQLLAGILTQHLRSFQLASVVSARQGAALDLIYRVQLRDTQGALPLVKAITSLEGVQNVELKED